VIKVLAAARAALRESPVAQRLYHGMSWSVVGSASASAISLLSLLVVARLLGKADYGRFVVIQSTLSMVAIFAGAGLAATITRYVAELHMRDAIRVARVLRLTYRVALLFSLVGTAALFVSASAIAKNLLVNTELELPLRIASMSIFFVAMDAYQKGLLIGLEAMRELAVGMTVATVCSMAILLWATYEYGLTGGAAGLVMGALIQFLVSRSQCVLKVRKLGVLRGEGSLREWRVLRDFAVPSLLAGVVVVGAHWLSHTMLARSSRGFGELAVLGVAMQWFNVIVFLPNVATRPVLPLITDRLAAGHHGEVRAILRLAVFASLIVCVPISLVIALASPLIMAAYGPQFADGWPSLAVITLTSILVVVASPVGQVLAASSKMWTGASMNLAWAAIFLACGYFMLDLGALGIALGSCIAYLFHLACITWYSLSRGIGRPVVKTS
jgi:O-antigen/teichoic acid export membrane protein